ncbi:MAG: hypothetical protein ACRDPA_26640, partial [Solirubrobacteraceae bacterium]
RIDQCESGGVRFGACSRGSVHAGPLRGQLGITSDPMFSSGLGEFDRVVSLGAPECIDELPADVIKLTAG